DEASLSALDFDAGSRYSKQSNRYIVMRRNHESYISKTNLTLDTLIESNLNSKLSKKGDIKLVALLDEENKAKGDTFEATIQKVKSFGYQFVQITDKVDSYGTQIQDAVNGLCIASQNALSNIAEALIKSTDAAGELKLIAKKDGASFTKNLNLEPYKTYYCEYELKAEDGTEVKAEDYLVKNYETKMIEASYDRNCWYVVDSHYETFNQADKIDPFFQLSATPITLGDGLDDIKSEWVNRTVYPCYLKGTCRNYELYSKFETIKFTIPSGKLGVVSFDWTGQIGGEYAENQESQIKIDGRYIYADVMNCKGNGGNYLHPMILRSGEHTITLGVLGNGRPYDCLTAIDDLRVDIISTKPVSEKGSTTVHKNTNGYLSVTNEFHPSYKANNYIGLTDADGGSGYILSYAKVINKSDETSTYRFYSNYNNTYKKIAFIGATSYGDPNDRGSFYCKYSYSIGGNLETLEFETKRMKSHSGYYPRNVIRTYNGTKQVAIPAGGYSYDFCNNRYGSFSELFFIRSNQESEIVKNKRMVMIDNTSIIGETGIYNGKAAIGLTLPKGTYYLKSFKVYRYENGKKVYALNNEFESESSIQSWKKDEVEASIVNGTKQKEEEDKLVYKKGELVAYGI
ncbi:MAG: hypothetical protein VB095_02375, partial [Anaerovorax sp.]|nr:hypothetical protein [Anaerovorax sp.]